MLFYPWDSPGKNIGVGCHSSISLSRGPSQPRNQTHVTYVSCIGKWVLYHQRYLALRVKGLSLGAFLVDHVPLSGPRPWCLFAHLAPCYRFLPLFSSLPLWSSPFFKPQNRNTPVQGETPPPRASLQTAPRGSDLSTRTSQVPSSVPFLLHADVLMATVCLRFSARM